MEQMTHQEKVERLRELIKDIDIAMLTTVDEDGTLRSRPMGTQKTEFDGDLWFLTLLDTGKVNEIKRESQVNVSYARPKDQSYVSVSGRATLINDRAKIKDMWDPIYKTYFPNGPEDPNLRLLKVHVDKAEYWESSGLIATVIGFAKAMAGQEADIGHNEKITL
jgi:general stress protein 26